MFVKVPVSVLMLAKSEHKFLKGKRGGTYYISKTGKKSLCRSYIM